MRLGLDRLSALEPGPVHFVPITARDVGFRTVSTRSPEPAQALSDSGFEPRGRRRFKRRGSTPPKAHRHDASITYRGRLCY